MHVPCMHMTDCQHRYTGKITLCLLAPSLGGSAFIIYIFAILITVAVTVAGSCGWRICSAGEAVQHHAAEGAGAPLV